MLERFVDTFTITDGRRGRSDAGALLDVLLQQFGGCTFERGLYRVHTSLSAAAATRLVADAYPEFRHRASCFGFDWLGRQFAIDGQRGRASDPEVLMFEPGTGQVLEIPVPFSAFHDEELVEYTDEALASAFFGSWLAGSDVALAFDQCVGYRTPVFLGGSDDLTNLEISDIDVYWTIMGHLRLKAMQRSAGTAIGELEIEHGRPPAETT